MLWYKGWFETRFRLLFMLVMTGPFLFTIHRLGAPGTVRSVSVGIVAFASYSVPALITAGCAFLAGAGIATQPSLQATKGLHGSTLYTLSLPVSRMRLLAVRAGIGWLETAVMAGVLCCEMWFLIPALRSIVTPVEMFEQAVTIFTCSATVYFLSVLLATFLDDQWRVWGTLLSAAALAWVCSQTSPPAFADLFHAMGKGSPIVAHTMPWSAMAFSLGLSVMLFFAAVKVAQAREY
jgi:hypothetical protein